MRRVDDPQPITGRHIQRMLAKADQLKFSSDTIRAAGEVLGLGRERDAYDAPETAVSLGAGCVWLEAYDAVTTKAGRYVQGGGCVTVGVGGFVQGGGFGGFSKGFGTGASNLLEAEVVTADGQVRIANDCTNSDLFWALKGGGGGTFGVVTRLTLRTYDLPATFGAVIGTISAASDEAYRALVEGLLRFYRDSLLNPHWGEQLNHCSTWFIHEQCTGG